MVVTRFDNEISHCLVLLSFATFSSWMSSLAEQVSAAEQARLNKFQHSKEQLIKELLSMNKQMTQVISKKRKEIKGSMRSREPAGAQGTTQCWSLFGCLSYLLMLIPR